MKRLFQILRIVASLIIGLIFTFNFVFSLPIASHITQELAKFLILILLALICPRNLAKPSGHRHLLIDALTASVLAGVWQIGFVILWSRALNVSGLTNIFLSILIMCTLPLIPLALNHKPVLLIFLSALFIAQILFSLAFSDPIFASLSFVVATLSALLWSVNNRFAFLKAFVSLFTCTVLFFFYYAMNLDTKLIVPVFIIAITIGLFMFQQRWRASCRPTKFANSAVTIGMVFSLFSIFSFVCWLPSPIQSLIAKSQKGVEILLHPRQMPAGIRTFVPQEEGWLVALYDMNPYKRNFNIYITMIDKKGKIIRVPFQSGTRLDRIACPNLLQDVCFVLGVNGKLICALDVDNWKLIACSEDNGYFGHLTVSPDAQFVAVYGDEPKSRLKVYDFGDAIKKYKESQKSYELIPALSTPKSLSECCSGNAIRFIDNHRLVVHDHFKHALYIIDVDKQQLKLKDKIEGYRGAFTIFKILPSKDKRKVLVPKPFDLEIDELPGGEIEVVDIEKKRVEKEVNSPLMTGLRRLVYIPELDAYCGASEFGLLFVFDKDLNLKKTLYAGAHIRYIHVEGKKLYFASQAGLVKIDLENIKL